MPRVKSVEGWMAVVVIVIITTRFNFVPARNNSFPIEYNNSEGPRILNQPALHWQEERGRPFVALNHRIQSHWRRVVIS